LSHENDLLFHLRMLSDEVRMRAYRTAIEATVRPGDVVADLGSGSGVLGLLCARAGAARVFCVEKNACMVERARRIAADNGLSDRLEFLTSPIEELTAFPAPVDVLVSETMGPAGIDEGMFRLFSHCVSILPRRPRCIPAAIRVLAAPIHFPALGLRARLTARVEGLDFTSLADGIGHIPQVLPVTPEMLVSPERELFRGAPGFDLLPEELTARWDLPPAVDCNAVGIWFRADLVVGVTPVVGGTPGDGVTLANGPEGPDTHWNQLVLPLLPALEPADGPLVLRVWPRFAGVAPRWKWQVTWGDRTYEGDPDTLGAPGSVDD
jgi:hypothetical protein